MGVVHEHSEVLAGIDGLEAPGHPDAAPQRGDERVEVIPERVHDRERAERVGDVESPGHRQHHLACAGGHAQCEAAPVEVAAQVGGSVGDFVIGADRIVSVSVAAAGSSTANVSAPARSLPPAAGRRSRRR